MTGGRKVDMVKELYISSTRSLLELKFPPKPKHDYLKTLDTSADEIERFNALDMLVQCYRCNTIRNSGWFLSGECDQAIKTILKYGCDSEDMREGIGVMLVKEGVQSEKVHDFDSAFKFYEASLKFGIYNPEFRYLRLKNIAFCLCLKGRFDSAEEFIRGAVALEPERYGGWKNLGIVLEHQGKFQEAADCYRKAIDCSRGEQRCVRHYKRLLARQPTLRNTCPPL